jgi:hypothetical protein
LEEGVAIGMSAPFRFPRAFAFTAAMFALAAGAHVLARGAIPHPAIFAGLFALVLLPVMVLAKIRVNSPVMAGLLIGGQLVLHEAFTTLSASTGFTPAHGTHVHPGEPLAAAALAAAPEHLHVPDTLMLVLHALATLATALVLARGEAAVWALAAWLRPLIRFLTAALLPDWPQLPAPHRLVVVLRASFLRLPALRGPPRTAAAS